MEEEASTTRCYNMIKILCDEKKILCDEHKNRHIVEKNKNRTPGNRNVYHNKSSLTN